jgi:hypothetical protein
MKLKINALLFIITMCLTSSLATITLGHASPETRVSVINPATKNGMFTFYTDTVNVGHKFKVTFNVSAVINMALWQVSLQFNPTHINCLNVSIPTENIFKGKVVIAPDPVIDNTGGILVYGATVFPTVGVSGSGVLCEAWFEIKSAPPKGQTLTSTLQLITEDTFTTKLEDPEGNPIPYTPENGTYQYISTETPPQAKIYIDPPRIVDATLTPCNNFTININIQEVEQLYSFNLTLTFNATILSALEAKIGPFLPPTTNTTINIDNTAGIIHFSASIQPPEEPPSGNGTIFTVTFHVEGLGQTSLNLTQTILLDPQANPINHIAENGYFNNMLIGKLAVEPSEIINPELVPPKTFQINITIDDVENLYAYEFTLSYDPNILTCIGIIFQDALNETNYTPQFAVNNIEGSLWVNVTYHTPAAPITTYKPIPLVTIIFRVKGLGATPLDLHDTSLHDSEGKPITHEAIDGFFMAVIRDIAITNIVVWPTKVYPGRPVYINVTVQNKGDLAETFNVTAYYDSNTIKTIIVENLPSRNEVTITLVWNTTGLTPCNIFAISAKAGPVPYEINLEDNTYIDGTVKIKILGDINGDGIVDMTDIGELIRAFGATPASPRWNQEADLNFDNKIDMTDVGIILRNYAKRC